MNELELLRQYEPILRFTNGEFFYPCSVNSYLLKASLWKRRKGQEPELLVPPGELDVELLAAYKTIADYEKLYIRFVDEPLDTIAYGRWLRRKDRPRFKTPGRLARVGLLARMIDSGFDIALYLRGKVPGGTVAAADIKYREILAEDHRYVYYGRILRENGYIILHYLFFYPMNNWRSTYYGVNDHEADWEQVFVYLADKHNGEPEPLWVAYASHDFFGDDLRRRWDDPDFHRDGTHPIVYVGAGSHASYFLPGEYLTRVGIGFAQPVVNALWRLQDIWWERLGQGEPTERDRSRVTELLSLPFVDYARGDGLSVGPGQNEEWAPLIISDSVPWVNNYRGLWGLDTRDPLQGENAPAGPKFNRDGTVRESWNNPLGWSGLHKVPPPQKMPHVLHSRIEEMQNELEAVRKDIDALQKDVPKLNLEVIAEQRFSHMEKIAEEKGKALEQKEAKLNALYAKEATLRDTILAAFDLLADLEAGHLGDPQAHLHHKHIPQTSTEVEQNALLESWSALSAGLLLLGLAILLLISPSHWFLGILALSSLFISIEAALRRRLQEVLLSISVILAIATTVVLIYQFFQITLMLIVAGIAILIIATNWRELRGN